MKDFTRAPGRLRALPLPARVVYSAFLVFTLAGLAFSVLLVDDMVGLDLNSIDTYYGGDVSIEDDVATPGGPVIELPPEAAAVGSSEAMPRRKLLEITHFHLFSMPVFLLILSHLYMLGRTRNAVKVFWIVVATASTALHIAAPWIAIKPSSISTAVYAISGTGLAGSYLLMTLVPLYEMWAPMQDRK